MHDIEILYGSPFGPRDNDIHAHTEAGRVILHGDHVSGASDMQAFNVMQEAKRKGITVTSRRKSCV